MKISRYNRFKFTDIRGATQELLKLEWNFSEIEITGTIQRKDADVDGIDRSISLQKNTHTQKLYTYIQNYGCCQCVNYHDF